jgi:hypothetical protein
MKTDRADPDKFLYRSNRSSRSREAAAEQVPHPLTLGTASAFGIRDGTLVLGTFA